MARIRSVKPEICESETMAALPAEVERTFVRLWTHCDDSGRCKDDPRLIKAAIYPLHDDMTAEVVESNLADLEAAGLIVRYEAEGKRYLACTSWAEHQHPQRPRESKIPAPPDTCTRDVRDTSATQTDTLASTSGPVVVVGEVGVEVGGGVEGDPSSSQSDPLPRRSIDDEVLDEIARMRLTSTQQSTGVGFPSAWLAKCRENLPGEVGDRVAEVVAAYDEPPRVLAEIVEGKRSNPIGLKRRERAS